MILTIQIVNGQQKQKTVGKDVLASDPINTLQGGCPNGLYPNGSNCYPCLGCHPCGNTYCDDNTNAIAKPINKINISTLIDEVENGSTVISKKDLKRLIIENSTLDGAKEKPKVKCGCGTNIYAKDEDACSRICKFLGSDASKY